LRPAGLVGRSISIAKHDTLSGAHRVPPAGWRRDQRRPVPIDLADRGSVGNCRRTAPRSLRSNRGKSTRPRHIPISPALACAAIRPTPAGAGRRLWR